MKYANMVPPMGVEPTSFQLRYSGLEDQPDTGAVVCDNCGISFHKKPNEIARSNHNFCCKSCSATFTNKGRNRHKPTPKICKKCGEPFATKYIGAGLHCPRCFRSMTEHREKLKSATLESYHNLPSVKGKHPSWRNTHIRLLNRSWNAHLRQKPCANCGYTKHVELAHIKPITSFPPTATLGEVNAESNNIPVCRNCHWELDHGLLNIAALSY